MNLKQWRMTQQVATKEGGTRTMTQADAARRVGVTRACWNAWEAGKRRPRRAQWSRIWAVMGIAGGPGDNQITAEALWRDQQRTERAQRKIYDARHATSKRKRR